jgi:CBS domain-containing protein
LATPQIETQNKLPGTLVDSAYEKFRGYIAQYKTARDLMSPNVITTTPEAPLEEAAKIMGEKHVGSLIVMKYKTPVGIVTERDLLSKVLTLGLFLKDETVKEVMSYPLLTVSVDASIKQVAQQMISKKGRLAVFDAGVMVGIVTASDLIKSLPDVAETEVKVDDFMTKEVVTADEETSVLRIGRIMGSEHIGSVIITHKDEPIGIFTERDLLTNFLATGKALFLEVGPVCSQPLVTIPLGTSVHMTAAMMATKHIRRLPVVKDNKIVGIITARDLVEAYAK